MNVNASAVLLSSEKVNKSSFLIELIDISCVAVSLWPKIEA